MAQQKSEDRVVPEGGVMPAERAGSSPGGQGKAVPVEETAVQLRLPIATAENPQGATRRRSRDRFGADPGGSAEGDRLLSAAEIGHAGAALGGHRGVGYERRSKPVSGSAVAVQSWAGRPPVAIWVTVARPAAWRVRSAWSSLAGGLVVVEERR